MGNNRVKATNNIVAIIDIRFSRLMATLLFRSLVTLKIYQTQRENSKCVEHYFSISSHLIYKPYGNTDRFIIGIRLENIVSD